MTDLHEIIAVLDDTPKDLTTALAALGEWRGWVVYFLEALEAETEDQEEYKQMLTELVTDVSLRIDSGRC